MLNMSVPLMGDCTADCSSTTQTVLVADCHEQISTDVCSIEEVLHHIDNAIQYGEDADVKIRDYDAPEGDDEM